MKLSKTYNLSVDNPVLASQWHPVKNGDLKPKDVSSGSNKKVWWVCEKGHEWQAKIPNRNSNNTSCPFCAIKSTKYALPISNPELADN